MAGRTQEALYSEIDLELSWSEDELPQVKRTKHVHALHPYLGKFIPQLVDVFLQRHFRPGQCVYDPFVGSGTTLVEANAYGCDAIGADISAFNCLLAGVKTARYSLGALELALKGALETSRREGGKAGAGSPWLETWYSECALSELLAYRAASEQLDPDTRAVAHVILSRAARSARMTTHYDLDFPKQPVRQEYWCLKHKRMCRPVEEAAKFLRRYTVDTIRRLREFSLLRQEREVVILHGDARDVELPLEVSGVITSPPYPGLIDYHEQHHYSYELLGLDDRREDELGRAARGTSRSAINEYVDGMIGVFENARRFLINGARVVIVVNDSRALYPTILDRAGLVLEERLTRHVNRRTGRRAGEFFEDVLICRVGNAS
jgi:DNA methylase